MDVPARREDPENDETVEEPEAVVTSHETRPGKIVFTERDNCDGWIATDLPSTSNADPVATRGLDRCDSIATRMPSLVLRKIGCR